MAEYFYSPDHKTYIKECPKCETIYIGGDTPVETERILPRYFAQDSRTKDGFYGRCKICVSKYQRASRDGRTCDPDALMEEQEGKCGICKKPINYDRGNAAKVTAYIDHNHTTNEVRGLLCPRCNSLLSIVENVEWLQQAITYLQKYGWEFKWSK